MKRILIVDDDSASCELLREIFAEQGWSAEMAQTPERASELAESQAFDLVVSDVNLEAAESGLDLLRKLRDKCPVILVTGFGTLETAEWVRGYVLDRLVKRSLVYALAANGQYRIRSSSNGP